jgi:nicotinamide-nucleotide amidase
MGCYSTEVYTDKYLLQDSYIVYFCHKYFSEIKMSTVRAEIITIGDEILIGQIVDTNSAWMGKQLSDIGIQVHQITSVSDSREHILIALKEASQRASVVLITGGLGPTKDDVTKVTLSEYFNAPLVFNDEVFLDVERLFKMRGRDVSAINRKQAEIVSNCTPLRNEVGTAPGMWFDENNVIYVSMPGVPYEMKHLMKNHVLPRLKLRFITPIILHRSILTQGIGETILAEMIETFENNLPAHFKLAYLPGAGMVRLRLSATGVNEDEIKAEMDQLVSDLDLLVADFRFGFDEETIQEVLGKLLSDKKLTISTAESCTGGYISHLLTSVPGSSEWYMGSTITYSYKSKNEVLDIPIDLMLKHGAVSEEVVTSMVENVRKIMKTDCAVATSGVAGPGGGTTDKPVGTVWIGVALPGKVFAKKVLLGDNRLRTIQVASETALNILRKAIIASDL